MTATNPLHLLTALGTRLLVQPTPQLVLDFDWSPYELGNEQGETLEIMDDHTIRVRIQTGPHAGKETWLTMRARFAPSVEEKKDAS